VIGEVHISTGRGRKTGEDAQSSDTRGERTSVTWVQRLRVQRERHGWVWEQRGPSVEDEKRKTMLLYV
jgi:hypothetical protein